MTLLIILSILHGFAKVSQGAKFVEHPEIITYIAIGKWVVCVYLLFAADFAMREVVRVLISMFAAGLIGKGIFRVLYKGI